MSEDKIIDFNRRKEEILKNRKAAEDAKIHGSIIKRIRHLIKKPPEEKE